MNLKVVYWDEFTLAMMEELENSSRLESEDLRAWQTFLHLIVENMLNGYDHAKNTQIEKWMTQFAMLIFKGPFIAQK